MSLRTYGKRSSSFAAELGCTDVPSSESSQGSSRSSSQSLIAPRVKREGAAAWDFPDEDDATPKRVRAVHVEEDSVSFLNLCRHHRGVHLSRASLLLHLRFGDLLLAELRADHRKWYVFNWICLFTILIFIENFQSFEFLLHF